MVAAARNTGAVIKALGETQNLFHRILAASALVLIADIAWATGPGFKADFVFTGSTLDKAWQTKGAANWAAHDGEIIGTPTAAPGGWLILDKSFQNVVTYANVYCPPGCEAGFLYRAEKTPGGGLKGIYVSVSEKDYGPYAVELDASGNETSRSPLASAVAQGIVGTVNLATAVPHVLPLPPELGLPDTLQEPTGEFKPGQWNTLQVLLHDDNVFPNYNGGNLGFLTHKGSFPRLTKESDGRYGPIAIYVGGTKPVEVKDFRWKDISKRTESPEVTSPNFKKIVLDDWYFGWTTAVADVNHDGFPDVIAGPYYYVGPNFTERHEIYSAEAFNPMTQYPIPAMVSLVYDFTGDGWPDVLMMSGNAGNGIGTLYVNPRGENRYWDHYVVLPKVGNEETLLKDIDGDGKPEIIHSLNNRLVYSKPDPANPTGPWITTNVSEPGPWGAGIGHGLGVGDINGDGRMDFINCYGWWEQPEHIDGKTPWKYHPAAFGRWGATQGGAGGAELAVYDVNGDGLMDVVGPVEGHGYGLAWWEQKRGNDGTISFVTHMIMDNFLTKNAGDVTFTEPHAAAFADMDGDGIPDMITGKRSMSHFAYSLYQDPDPFGEPVLYVYKVRRNKNAPGGAEFVPELVHNRSGVGSHIVVEDLNGDGRPDIVTSGVFGTFVFLNEEKSAKK
jgi:hypothetical protein